MPSTPRSPWTTVAVVLVGTMLVTLNMTAVNIALPEMGRDLRLAARLDWIVTSYLLAVGVVQPATGWLSDRFGMRTVFLSGLLLFSIGSLLVALAQDITTVALFRAVQGFGGGAVFPVGLALIHQAFPPDRRGTALGMWGMAMMVGPAIGPVAGGWIVGAASWRWLFLVNVPLGVTGVAVGARKLVDASARESRPLDVPGLLLVGGGVTAVLVGVSLVGPVAWTSPSVGGLVLVGAAALTAFVWRELRVPAPLLDLRMFAIPGFAVTIGLVWLMTAAQFAVIILVPISAQSLHGLSPLEAGLVLAPAAAAAAAFMPLSGRITDRIGPRAPVLGGVLMMAAASAILAILPLGVSPFVLSAAVVLHGAGSGLGTPPITLTGMNVVPTRLVSQASALRSANRQVSAALSTAVLAAIITARIGGLSGEGVPPEAARSAYALAFVLSACALVVALAVASALPGREQNLEIQRSRAAEQEEPAAHIP